MKFEINKKRSPLNMLDIFNPSILDDFYGNESSILSPNADIIEREHTYVINIALPGLSKKDIKIDLSDNKLNISGSFEKKELMEKDQFLTKEIKTGSFLRSFELGFSVNQSEISASFSNGILSLELPKSEKALKKVINIK